MPDRVRFSPGSISMGMMKKAVRRATPKPVRKAKAVVKHPVGTAARAATPRSVRNAKRTAFNVTHPVNTAENKILNAATPKPRRRSRRPTAGDNLSGAANAAITTLVCGGVLSALIIGQNKAAAYVAFGLAAVVYLIVKLGEVGDRPAAPGMPAQRAAPVEFPARITQAWLEREVPHMPDQSFSALVATLRGRGWQDPEIATRVLPLRHD